MPYFKPVALKPIALKPVALALAVACFYAPVRAQTANEDAPVGEGASAGPEFSEIYDAEEIVVSAGQREYGAVLGDAQPELRFTPGDIMSFGVTSIGELLEELNPQVDGGSAEPVILLNGKRLKNVREIRRYPSRAILRVDVFTPDVAVRYGYAPSQKVVNIVLRPNFSEKSLEVEVNASSRFDHSGQEVEANSLLINRDRRIFLTAQYTRSDRLLASRRLDEGRYDRQPFSLQGNVGPGAGRGEIDPALSGLAGEAVTIAALPEGGGALSLEELVATANRQSVTDLNDYRTLLPSMRAIEAAGSITGKIGEEIDATFSLDLEQIRRSNLVGLAGVSLPVASGNPYSPFAEDVTVYQYTGGGPLERRQKTTSVEATTTANGTHDGWNWDMEAGLTYDRQRLRADRGVQEEALAAVIADDPLALDPFDLASQDLGQFAAYDLSVETSRVLAASLLASRVIGRTGAGEIATSLSFGAEHSRLTNEVTESATETSRTGELFNASGTANVSIPLLSADKDLGSPIGGVTVTPYLGFDTSGKFGIELSWGAGLAWTPHGKVQVTLNYSDDAVFPSMSNLYGIEFRLPGELVYDPRLGRMVSATEISGGNTALEPGRQETVKADLTLKPITGKSYTLTANVTHSTLHDGITRFPDPTAALEAQFPERFIRDAEGTLIAFDSRPVNAHRSTTTRLRFGFNATWQVTEAGITADTSRGGPPGGPRRPRGEAQNRGEALGTASAQNESSGAPARVPGMGPRRTPPGRIHLGLFHTWTLQQELQLYQGGQTLDLLDGEGSGSRSGTSPHVVEAQLGYFKAGTGLRLRASWNSPQTINRDPATGNFARIKSYYSLDARVFKFFNPRQWEGSFLSGVWLSLEAENLTGTTPKIVGSNGYVTNTDNAERYLGTTLMAKVRKSF